MRTRYEPPAGIYLDPDQLQQHTKAGEELQRANCHASQLLLKLCRYGAGERECRQVRTQLLRLAAWMNLLMDSCERLAEGTTSTDVIVNVRVGGYCRKCEGIADSNRTSPHRPAGILLGPDEAWAHQVRLLLNQTRQAAKYAFARDRFGEQFQRTPESLAKLNAAVRRQERHLRLLDPHEVKINLQTDFESCVICGEPASSSEIEPRDELQ